MPSRSPAKSPIVISEAESLGRRIRDRRKVLGVSATAAAESAGMSRATWHRIEQGELSVTLGAYLSALEVLDFPLVEAAGNGSGPTQVGEEQDLLPLQIQVSDFPQLKRLAWQVHGVNALTPREAWSFYQRNWRHVDIAALEPSERHLIGMLRDLFSDGDGL